MDNHLPDIVSDLKKENCVLILGPDIIDFGEKTFFETMFNELSIDNQYKTFIDTAPQYVFVNEDLVQLQPNGRETSVLRMMERFYQKQTAFDEPLTKISQIPFHLIISLLPDERLQNIFRQQRLEFSYGHYPREQPPLPIAERPTQKKPLIYNLVGDFNEGDVIITFDHLFEFLSGIMGKRELPQYIREALKKARTFIFLGVHFEKWYVQLLLKIITSKERKEKYSILKNGNTNDVCAFVAKRLELDFIPGEPLSFLDDLYNECKEQNLLKKVPKVFISYSHKDKASIQILISKLRENNIKVIIDDSDMISGQRIDDFIATIKDVDIVVAIVSNNSLLSPWVIKEIHTTLTKTDKYLLPCNLDESFLDKNFFKDAKNFVDSREDLTNKQKEWSEYLENLPYVLDGLQNIKSLPIKAYEFNDNISIVLDEINKLMQLK